MGTPRIDREAYEKATDWLYGYDGSEDSPGGIRGEAGDAYVHSVGLDGSRTAAEFVNDLYFGDPWGKWDLRGDSPEGYVAMMEAAAERVPAIASIVADLRPAMEAAAAGRGLSMDDWPYDF